MPSKKPRRDRASKGRPEGSGGESGGAPVRAVVAIGASAGGLEALRGLLAALSTDTGATFVILQHLSPDEESLTPEILAGDTSMPVHDLGLPGSVSGYDVARAVRADESGRSAERVRLVALTGYGSDADRDRALGAGFDDFLVKPVSRADFRRLLGGDE